MDKVNGKPVARRQVAQGDVLFRRVPGLPKGCTPQKPEADGYVVAHSETGHHHTVDATGVKVYQSEDPLVAYLVMESVESVDVEHQRSWDTHATFALLGDIGACWEVRRQAERTPQGWARVQD